jgi:hypothetical protein
MSRMNLSEVPNRGAVYVVKDARGKVLDVGESKAVGRRLSTHERRTCWEDHSRGGLHIDLYFTNGLQRTGRRELEREIRAKLGPKCGVR